MKRILVIANLHHSSPRIPGLLFPLSKLGLRVSLLTPPLGENSDVILGFPEGFRDHVDIVEVPFRGDIFWILRRFLNFFGYARNISYTEQIKDNMGGGGVGRSIVNWLMQAYQTLFAIPDTEWPWHKNAYKKAKILLSLDHYDLILSSSPYPTVHVIAASLKKDTGIPWIADFRDPWSQSHNYTLPYIRLLFDTWLEKRTLAGADLITTVSSGFASKLLHLHNKQVLVVPNGYQPLQVTEPVIFNYNFTISYTGTIYTGKQNPDKILLALKNLISAKLIDPARVSLDFYGRYDSALQATISAKGLETVAKQLGSLSRHEIRQKQRASHMLLLLLWEVPEEEGIFPLKFFEYLDARRPILATGTYGKGEIAEILKHTCAGMIASDQKEIEDHILNAYKHYMSCGVPEYHGVVEAILKYSYTESAKKLSDCFSIIKCPI